MPRDRHELALVTIAVVFSLFFAAVVIPALLDDRDVIGAFAAGFDNPYASGYSFDVILCWVTLVVLIVHDARTHGVQHGWRFAAIGLVPGVAVGLPLYLISRRRQLDAVVPDV